MSNLKWKNIEQWIEDLCWKDSGVKFNADVFFYRDKHGRLVGDASIFLAARHAPIDRDVQLGQWLATIQPPPGASVSSVVIHKFTGIPIVDAEALISPKELLEHPTYDLARLTGAAFVHTLRNYLDTGKVDWSWVLK